MGPFYPWKEILYLIRLLVQDPLMMAFCDVFESVLHSWVLVFLDEEH